MKVQSIAWTTFHIPLITDFTTAHGPLRVREGTIVRVGAEGLTGYGETSTVPGFPGPGVDQIGVLLEILGRELLYRDTGDAGACFAEVRGDPSARLLAGCALDVALHDLRGKATGVSVAELLGGDPKRTIPVNATVGATDRQAAARAAKDAIAAGFSCVKLKVGTAGSLEEEMRRVSALREAMGWQPRLRLDANGAWDPETAISRIRALETLNIELVEQPVPEDDLDGMAKVRSAVHTPIAADEAASSAARVRRIIDLGAADVLVIKPMAVGGIEAAMDLIRLARAAGLGAIVTTSIDSGIGIAAATHLAATLADQPWACGLATASLLMSDLAVQSIPIANGVAKIPEQPGLGFDPDEAAFRLYTDGWHGIQA